MSDELLDKPGTTPEQTGEPEGEVDPKDSERPEDADREAEAVEEEGQGRTDWKSRYLTEVTPAREEKNRLEREKAVLEERLRAAQPSPTADPQMAQDQNEIRRIQQAVAAISADAEAGVPYAVVQMALLSEQYQAAQQRSVDRRESMLERELGRIRDEDEREEVRAYFDAHRNEYATVTAARKAWLGEKYESEHKTLAAKTKQADEVVANKRAGIVKTYARDVATPEAKSRRMTESDYDNDISRLRAEGDHVGVRRMMRELQSDAIKLTPG
jgi:hypothetical protein